MAVIEIKNLVLSRGGRQLLNNFNVKLTPGSITAVVGPNGSGKSTLLAAIAGDLTADSGSIQIDGRDLKTISLIEQAGLRGVVLQNHAYWLSYTVLDVISMGQTESVIAKIPEVLAKLHMTEFANQSVTTLSGGEAQRLDIARALIRDCPIYLFDEPLSAQDAISKKRLIKIFTQLRNQGKTILVIAHIDPSSLTWCDQVIDIFSE